MNAPERDSAAQVAPRDRELLDRINQYAALNPVPDWFAFGKLFALERLKQKTLAPERSQDLRSMANLLSAGPVRFRITTQLPKAASLTASGREAQFDILAAFYALAGMAMVFYSDAVDCAIVQGNSRA